VIVLLDTNILIYLIKNHPPQVAERIDASDPNDQIAMSFVTWAELLQGAAGSQRREATLRQLDLLARQVPVLYPDGPEICRHYAQQAHALRRRGTSIGANGLWIACHALALGATLVSHNTRELARIDGLRLEDWALPDP
jgi:tRNA(fMet)-specific endonuclease VapC